MSDKIDVLSFNPAEVATKLIKKDESQAGGATITVKAAVDCCFRDLGHTDVTYGAFNHEFQAWMINLYPKSMFAAMSKGVDKEKIKEMQDQKEKDYEAALAKKGLENPNKVSPSDTKA